MKNSIPLLIFLRSLGLTEEKILLSINDYIILTNLKYYELKIFKKFQKSYSYILKNSFVILGKIFTQKEQNIVRIY
jgi:hypothetical protein